jgi:hypothetical protein
MFRNSIIAATLFAAFGGPAWAASDCLKDLTTLDQRYGLGVTQTAATAPPPQAPVAASEAPPPAPGPNSQLDTVPNTGGVVDRPPDQLQPLASGLRSQVKSLLEEAKQADAAGDGTVCAARLGQARQIAQQAPGTPSDLH